MRLTSEQIRQFQEEGYFFLPGCFSDEEVAVRATRRKRSTNQIARRCGGRRPERRAPLLRRIPITRRSASLERIRGWSNPWSRSLAKGSTRTSSL